MNIKIRWAAIALLMMGVFTSCIMHDGLEDCPNIPDIPDVPVVPEKKELRVISAIDLGEGNTLWPEGSAIGITVLKAGTNECFGDNADKHYVVQDTEAGASIPNESVEPIYLPDGDAKVDVIAYYPYAIPFDATYQVNLSALDQSKPDLLDLITADRVCGVASDAELIELKFFRRMTKLIFNIQLVEVEADGEQTVVNERLPGTSLTITGMRTTGVYSLPENQLTLDAQVQDIATPINPAGINASAIVFPRAAAEGVTFLVALPDGTQHTFLMDPRQALDAGTENRFDVVIKLNKEPLVKPEYTITYAFVDGLSADNVTVTRGAGATAEPWPTTESVTVEAGGSFAFAYQNNGAVVKSIVVNQTVLANTNEHTPYELTDIRADQHIVFGGVVEEGGGGEEEGGGGGEDEGEKYPVKLLINLPDRDPSSVLTMVGNHGSYTFKLPILASEQLVMTINGVTTEPTPDSEGYYTIEDIQSAQVIVITVEKVAEAPDAFITADVHQWTVLEPIDGGIILPE